MTTSRPNLGFSVSTGWMLALASVLSCTQTPVIVPATGGSGGAAADGGSSSRAEACVAAGGKCVIGPGLGCLHVGSQDCNPTRNPGGAICCLDEPKVCDQDGGVASIASADYDRTCAADADCVAVSEGNVCLQCLLVCPSGVVSHNAETQYRSDLAKLTDPATDARCNCPREFVPCCIAGQCHADPMCDGSH